jgi:hypothetical protein
MATMEPPAILDGVMQQPTPPDSEIASAKPWASGRVLSKAQRDRKREVDRISKARRRRDNTESRDTVDYLKKQVEELSLKVKTLEREEWLHIDSSKINTRRLQHDFPPDAYRVHQQPAHSSFIAPPLASAGFYHSTLNSLQTVDPFTPQSSDYGQGSAHDPTAADALPTARPPPLLPGEVAATSPLATQSTSVPLIKDMFNMLVQEAKSAVNDNTRHLVVTDTVLTQDAVIRGILHGWPSVVDFSSDTNSSNSSNLLRCPILRTVSKLDGLIFSFSTVLTRLISLRAIHLMLLYITACIPISELPPWYRPRPTQQHCIHEPVIDLLPWPGLRERAIWETDLIKQNHLWRSIVSLFSFNWPYAQELAVVQLGSDASSPISASTTQAQSQAITTTSGLNSRYIFSDAYNAQMWDIRMWNISLEFFESFPQLYEDIVPKAYVAPLYLRPSGSGSTAAGLIGAGMSPSAIRRWNQPPRQLMQAHPVRKKMKMQRSLTVTTMPSSYGLSQSPTSTLSATTTEGGSHTVEGDHQPGHPA